MNVLIFGATGMVGQGVLKECLESSDVENVTTLGRTAPDTQNPKLKNISHSHLFDYSDIENDLKNFDACFFCLGVSSNGMKEETYTKLTYDLTLTAAKFLARLNPQMVFVYVSGAGTDSSEKGGSMWARVKGRTENDLLKLPFKSAYMFRPGMIQPLDGIRSKTKSYQIIYSVLKPVLPFLRYMFPHQILSTRQVGQAMIAAAKIGSPKKILEIKDIFNLSQGVIP